MNQNYRTNRVQMGSGEGEGFLAAPERRVKKPPTTSGGFLAYGAGRGERLSVAQPTCCSIASAAPLRAARVSVIRAVGIPSR